jgi:Heparinase II/III-like protein
MKSTYLMCSIALSLLTVVACSTSQPQAQESYRPKTITRDFLQSSLVRDHPRLFLSDQELSLLKSQIAGDTTLSDWQRRLEQSTSEMMVEPPVEYKLKGTSGLLEQSRKVLKLAVKLGGLYRLDDDVKKAERLKAELLAAASLPDWNPAHFLDTAEMSLAVALGYDWLYSYLTEHERHILRTALVEKGLKEGLAQYKDNPHKWALRSNNWNQVCNGGLAVAALAIADEEPALAAEILDRAYHSIQTSMKKFDPDGGDPEGPMYWRYGTRYNVFYLAAMKSALGTDFGLSTVPGFSETGNFRIHSVGPTGSEFNFSDAREGNNEAPQMMWFAREFNNPLYYEEESRFASNRSPNIFHLIWSLHRPKTHDPHRLPLNVFFKNINVAMFRSNWNDPRALYVGFKGGDNANGSNHSHLDLGSFVFELLGERWAIDLGSDDYNLPGYFLDKRWNYFRLQNASHNTLTIDDDIQIPTATAPIIQFKDEPHRAFATVDLTEAYANKVTSAKRGLMVVNKEEVLIQDEIKLKGVSTVQWNFYTRAKIEIHGSEAILSQGTSRIRLNILSPKGIGFETAAATAPLPQRQQPDVHSLRINLKNQSQNVRIVVSAARLETPPKKTVPPLSEWGLSPELHE